MSLAMLTESEFGLIQTFIEDRCGIAIHPSKRYLIETRLAKLVAENGCGSFGEFYELASGSSDQQLVDDIIDAITTNETSWFRDGAPWLTFRDIILPEFECLAAENQDRHFRIWSAGCSTGQEPYSLAMLISEFCETGKRGSLTPDHFHILGTDISRSALTIARSGKYDRISMKRGFNDDSNHLKRKYFSKDEGAGTLHEKIKNRVSFKKFNLQQDFALLGLFHLVFIRNVTIYFSDTLKRDVLSRLENVLLDPGYVFFGAAETPLSNSGRLERLVHERTFYYRKCRQGSNP